MKVLKLPAPSAILHFGLMAAETSTTGRDCWEAVYSLASSLDRERQCKAFRAAFTLQQYAQLNSDLETEVAMRTGVNMDNHARGSRRQSICLTAN